MKKHKHNRRADTHTTFMSSASERIGGLVRKMLQAETEATPFLKEVGEAAVGVVLDAARICVFSDDETAHNDADGLERDTETR